LRLKTLLDKKRVIQARIAATSRLSASFATLVEGFQQFDNDLNKLQVSLTDLGEAHFNADGSQQFVEVNETAISKILKKVGCLSVTHEQKLIWNSGTKHPRYHCQDLLHDYADTDIVKNQGNIPSARRRTATMLQ
jgi:CDK inhibitor PHO81